jgi:hypothetical protein
MTSWAEHSGCVTAAHCNWPQSFTLSKFSVDRSDCERAIGGWRFFVNASALGSL